MMFWGCFSLGDWTISCNKRIIKSEDYIKILDETRQLSEQNLGLGRRFTFQQDNDRKNMSISVTACLQKKKAAVLPWFSVSPDLNPIKNLWQELKVWINCQSPKNLHELEHIIIESKKFSEKAGLNLIKIFRKWLQQVIWEAMLFTINIMKIFQLFNFSYCMNNFVFFLLIIFLLILSKFNQFFSK